MVRSRVDYASDQITVYRFCPYGCLYCYVWRNKLFASRVQRGKYDPVEEARKYLRRSGRTIVVSFVSDPYPPVEATEKLTRRVLQVLCQTRNRVMVLTKNPGLALRDLDILRKGYDCWLGTTIVSVDDYQRKLEPNAPRWWDRMMAIEKAHEQGVKTWLSVEPIIPHITDVEEIIKLFADIIDYVVLGAYNYWRYITLPEHEYIIETEYGYKRKIIDPNPCCPEELRDWYRRHIPRAIEILETNGIQYHIKKELRKYLDGETRESEGET